MFVLQTRQYIFSQYSGKTFTPGKYDPQGYVSHQGNFDLDGVKPDVVLLTQNYYQQFDTNNNWNSKVALHEP